jgi:hypothetical protein
MPEIIWKGRSDLFTDGENTTLLEAPDSPQWIFGDKIRCIRKYRGLHSLCFASAPFKGTAGSGAMAGLVVAQSTVNRMPKQVGELVIEWHGAGEQTGQQLTPDTYGLMPTEVNPSLQSHPYFSTLTESHVSLVNAWVSASTALARSESKAKVLAITPTETKNLAVKLGEKMIRGQDSYYLAGWTYTWTSYWWTLPTVNDGGSIETPGGPLAGLLGSSLAWLRLADEHDFDGTQHRLTRAWRGVDAIDSDLYS